MALIKCPKCGHIVSDKGKKCPKCGWSILKTEQAKETIEQSNSSIQQEVDKPRSQTWKIVLLLIFLAAAVVGGTYVYQDYQEKVQLEYEAMLKAKADSAMVADSLARIAAIEQARLDSIRAAEELKQKFVKFEDVFDMSNNDINDDLSKALANRGYQLLKTEKRTENFDVAVATITYQYYGINMEYNGKWIATGSPCSGVEIISGWVPHVEIYFEYSSEMDAFLSDVKKAGFKYNSNEYGNYWVSYDVYDDYEEYDSSGIEVEKENDHILQCHRFCEI